MGDRTRHVAAGGQRLRWSARAGTGRPLLLVNGLGGNIEMWEPLRAALAPRPTIAFDAPGVGESSVPWWPLSIDQLGDLVGLGLDDLGVGDVDVLGYSFGGAVAQSLARRGGRVRKLALVASTSGWSGPPWWGPAATVPAMLELLTPARYYVAGTAPRWSAASFGDPRSSSFSHLDRARTGHPPHPLGYLWQLLAMAGWSSRRWLDRIAQDTLVLVGAEDRAAPPAHSEVLARGIPNCELQIVPGAGHLLLLADDVGDVAARLARFLDAPSRAAQSLATRSGPAAALLER